MSFGARTTKGRSLPFGLLTQTRNIVSFAQLNFPYFCDDITVGPVANWSATIVAQLSVLFLIKVRYQFVFAKNVPKS